MSTTAQETKSKSFKLDLNIARFGKYPAIIQREFLEHKTAFFTVPLVISLLLILGNISSALFSNNFIDFVHMTDGELTTLELSSKESFDAMTAQQMDFARGMASVAMVLASVPILLISPFVVLFPLLSSLYEERVERSYLFWKSMPVSDVEEVLLKLLFIAVLGPIILMGFMILIGYATKLIFTPLIIANNLPLLDLMWSAPVVSTWVAIYLSYLSWMLWALPLFSWCMLASAYAPKAPLLYAAVPPAAIMIGETILYDRTYLGEMIINHIGTKFGKVFMDAVDFQRFEDGERIAQFKIMDGMEAIMTTLLTPSFWAGAVVAGCFLAGAVYFRRFRT